MISLLFLNLNDYLRRNIFENEIDAMSTIQADQLAKKYIHIFNGIKMLELKLSTHFEVKEDKLKHTKIYLISIQPTCLISISETESHCFSPISFKVIN